MTRLLEKASQISLVGGLELQPHPLALSWPSEVDRIHELPLVTEPSLEEAINCYTPDSRSIIETAVNRG